MVTHLEEIVELFHHRWSAPVLAVFHREGGGAKFVTLAARLGVAKETMRRALKALIERGWARRNPGYGHPMRPEYVLSAAGTAIAKACDSLMKEVERQELGDVLLRKWSLPILGAIQVGNAQFSTIQKALPRVSPRALTLGLKDLQQAGLVERIVYDAFPPLVEYGVTAPGEILIPHLERLGRAFSQSG